MTTLHIDFHFKPESRLWPVKLPLPGMVTLKLQIQTTTLEEGKVSDFKVSPLSLLRFLSEHFKLALN